MVVETASHPASYEKATDLQFVPKKWGSLTFFLNQICKVGQRKGAKLN
jgi:hypothetical protein